jgi:DNA topoisomerase-3
MTAKQHVEVEGRDLGMNLSRAYSLAYSGQLSVGRVQTPTLAMVVERELAIRSFVSEDYLEIQAGFRPTGDTKGSTYQGTWFRTRPEEASDKELLQKAMRLPVNGSVAAVSRQGMRVRIRS